MVFWLIVHLMVLMLQANCKSNKLVSSLKHALNILIISASHRSCSFNPRKLGLNCQSVHASVINIFSNQFDSLIDQGSFRDRNFYHWLSIDSKVSSNATQMYSMQPNSIINCPRLSQTFCLF